MKDHKTGFATAELLWLCSSTLLVLLWGYAAFSKLADYSRFVEQLLLSPLSGIKRLAPFLGIVIPVIELSLVGLLFSERFRKIGLWLSFCLLLAFTIYISLMIFSGFRLPCSCGGVISKLGWKGHLLFNAFFMLISLLPFSAQKFFSN